MRTRLRALVFVSAAAAGLCGVWAALGFSSTHATVSWSTSGNIGAVPAHRDLVLRPLAADQTGISSDKAVSVAEQSYGLQGNEIDPSIGVVRAIVSWRGAAQWQNIRAWVVTADHDVAASWGPGLYKKLVVVVDATSGRDIFAYAADRSQS